MTREVDIERLLEGWLQEGPTEFPDRAFTTVADRIERQPQRGTLRLRLVDRGASIRIRWLVAAAAIFVAIVGAAVLGRLSAQTVGGPSTSPLATLAPTPTPTATPTRWSSTVFGITYELPKDWVNSRESEFWFLVSLPAGQESLEGVSVFRDAVIADQDKECSQTPKAGLGHSVDDFVTYLTTHPGLVTSGPTPVSIAGMSGQSLDLSLSPTWRQTCPFNGVSTVMFLTGEGGAHYLWGADRFEFQRIAFLDDGSDGAIVVAINSRSQSGFDALVRVAAPAVSSFVIEPRPRSTSNPGSPASPRP